MATSGIADHAHNGPLQFASGRRQHPDKGWRSKFSHSTEVAQAGYHAVTLGRYKTRAELSASAACRNTALHDPTIDRVPHSGGSVAPYRRNLHASICQSRLVHLFSRLDVAGGDLVSDGNILAEHDFVAVNDVTVAGPYGSNNNEHVASR
jgi:hypothetical protein